MKYLIGIDGGGSKTNLLCMDTQGNPIGKAAVGATYYRQDGLEAVIQRLRDGISQCLPAGETAAACFGMPGFGDNPEDDRQAAAQIAAAFPHIQFRFENDVVVGWAGALALNPGVNIVGGTGSIAYGRDPGGNSIRCGGWHEFFSDEGSGYWLGKRLLRLFSMESDGRLPRTQLYDIVRQRLNLQDDYDINVLTTAHYCHSRKETAALQVILAEAARAGDPYARECYRMSSEHLARIVRSTVSQLDFPGDTVTVSYSGGLFNLEDLITLPMRSRLEEMLQPKAMEFQSPLLTPCQGAVLLAAEEFMEKELSHLRSAMLSANV